MASPCTIEITQGLTLSTLVLNCPMRLHCFLEKYDIHGTWQKPAMDFPPHAKVSATLNTGFLPLSSRLFFFHILVSWAPSFSMKSLFFDVTLPSSYRQSWGSVFWVTRAFFTDLSFLISCVFIFLREKWIFLFALKSFGFFLISLKWVGFYYDLCQKRFWVIISLPCFFLISALPVLCHPMASLTLCHMQPWVPSSLSPHFLFPL